MEKNNWKIAWQNPLSESYQFEGRAYTKEEIDKLFALMSWDSIVVSWSQPPNKEEKTEKLNK